MLAANADIREAARKAGIRLWEVAERYGCNDGNFSRKLRHELSKEQKETIHQIILDLSEEKARGT